MNKKKKENFQHKNLCVGNFHSSTKKKKLVKEIVVEIYVLCIFMCFKYSP